ncbi:lysylphosphatidylglycerol synthase domain-containing protein [Citrobacter europaeus]|uniref:lysylphosphatidylglycerol synthase domain-containing protein n=1 Tax=Citrobacter europaeus TaxID=1914243 RepID=UPI001BD1AD49|nr:lysylphosphatidylglycerol synthase domain-containing protein [Citrobacter europaeus]
MTFSRITQLKLCPTIVGSLAFVYFSVSSLTKYDFSSFATALIVPTVAYIVAHFLRAIRLGVLLKAQKIRKLLSLHFYTAACSAVIPFKLGELIRINEVSRWENNYCKGILIVWIERIFDVVALSILALLIYLSGGVQVLAGMWGLLWIMLAFVFFSIVMFFVLPEQLSALNLHVIRSYRGRKAIKILHLLDIISSILEKVRPIVSEKILTLSILTIFIWIFELVSLMLFLDHTQIIPIVKDLLAQFSFVLTDSPKSLVQLITVDAVKNTLLIIFGYVSLFFYMQMNLKK